MIWTADPLLIKIADNHLNLTNSVSKAYVNNQVDVEPGVWVIFAGDVNQNENVDLFDTALSEVEINNFEFGHFATDINGDGNADLLKARL